MEVALWASSGKVFYPRRDFSAELVRHGVTTLLVTTALFNGAGA
jgi:hypothetical protein